MRHSTKLLKRAATIAALMSAAVALAQTARAQEKEPHEAKHEERKHDDAKHDSAAFPIPAALRAEHAEIHEALEAATKKPGRVGVAARELAQLLHPHFQREEQIALPPLGLLAPLARGDRPANMRDVLPMTDSLRAELPRMLEEHKAIRAATMRLRSVARAAGDGAVVRLAESLALHAQNEEEIMYPAAVLVGDLVRARSPASAQ